MIGNLTGQTRNMVFENISGFATPIKSQIIQDKQGFLWVGTQGGLVRYDGYKMKSYTTVKGDSTSLSSNSVNALAEDNSGRICLVLKYGYRLNNKLSYIFKGHIRSFIP
jgi:ligand-binding sensor domain-containing protein